MAPIISFSGIASGIDSKSLISALIERQRAAQVTPLTNRITELTSTNESLSELKSLLNKFKDVASNFRAVSGGSISKTAISSDDTILTATSSKSASAGSYEVTVTQLASNSTASFSDRFSSGDAVINSSINDLANSDDRTVEVQVGTGDNQETVTVELTSTTTASEFVSSFNASSTKAEASLVNVGTSSSPSYAIVISSKNTGTDKGTIAITTGSEIETAGSGALNDATLTQTAANNAIFSISGIGSSIERSSNQVSDVITGVTLNLSQIGTSTVTVQNDPDETKKTLQSFVDAYNEIISFVSENDAISSSSEDGETVNTFGTLANVSIDESVLTALRSSFSQSSKSGGLVNTLADLGITTQRDGTLSFNEQTFDTAFNNESTSVETILETLGEKLASVDGTVSQFTRYNGLIDSVINYGNADISRDQQRIYELEKNFTRQEESLSAQFARLESLMGKLNQQQSTLSSLLR
jgi:flagellar hook-associated protein 2